MGVVYNILGNNKYLVKKENFVLLLTIIESHVDGDYWWRADWAYALHADASALVLAGIAVSDFWYH